MLWFDLYIEIIRHRAERRYKEYETEGIAFSFHSFCRVGSFGSRHGPRLTS